MSRTLKTPSEDYTIGYGRPPVESRFRKGQSGNPRGRPQRTTTGRAKTLALQEAYRPITVREGDDVLTLPAIRAVMRQMVRLAAKGNGPAQRKLIDMVQTIEQELVVEAETKAVRRAGETPITDDDRAKALAAFVAKTKLRAPEDHAKLVRALRSATDVRDRHGGGSFGGHVDRRDIDP